MSRNEKATALRCHNGPALIGIDLVTSMYELMRLLALAGIALLLQSAIVNSQDTRQNDSSSRQHFGLHVVDRDNGRGVPLVEIRTVNEIRYFTDNEGWIAFDEAELMDREVYFHLRSGGYEVEQDGFGFQGFRITPKFGETSTVEVRRTLPAERLGRLTGEGRWEASTKLNVAPRESGRADLAVTLGQDSVQFVPYLGKLFWLWGDTSLAHYPLGNFHTTSAWTELPRTQDLDRADLQWEYLLDPESKRVRRMLPDAEPGAVWLFGLLSLPDPHGVETLVAHYSRHLSLEKVAEQGLAKFNHENGVFEKLCSVDVNESWRFPKGNSVRVSEPEGDFFYFAEPFLHTRVPADWASLLDREKYQSFWFDPSLGDYVWQTAQAPTTQQDESALLASGKMPLAKARYQTIAWPAEDQVVPPDDSGIEPTRCVEMHRGSVVYCPYRKKWVLVAHERGNQHSASLLGEVWYGESDGPTGPWHRVIRIASHDGYSFYNPRIHDYPTALNAQGNYLYFEGTFTKMFSPHDVGVPRYEYNQLLYRLNLDDQRLRQK